MKVSSGSRMKRSAPLRSDPKKTRAWQQRSKPLERRSELERKPLAGGNILQNDTPAARRMAKPPEDPIPQAVRRAVKARADNHCERCRRFCEYPHLHHVRLRSQGGGHTPDNLLALCDGCHGIVHAKPKNSHKEGTLYSAKWAVTIPWMFILDRRGAEWRNGVGGITNAEW